jgi:OFA family oxalate/formate antiporter-like MFS transporter
MIEAFGWRQTCFILAGVIGVLVTVAGLLFFRDTPEECGLSMDGISDSQHKANPKEQLHKVNHEFTRAEAVMTSSFWTFAMGLAVSAIFTTAISFHITSIADEMQMTTGKALQMFIYSSFIAIPTRLAISYLVDNTRFQLRWLLIVMEICILISMISVAYFNVAAGFILAVITFGLSGGMWGVLFNVAYPRYFGRKHLGAISGLNMSLMVISSAVGPAFYSYGKLWLGSYQKTTLTLLVLPVIVIVMALFTDNPQKKYEPAAEAQQ